MQSNKPNAREHLRMKNRKSSNLASWRPQWTRRATESETGNWPGARTSPDHPLCRRRRRLLSSQITVGRLPTAVVEFTSGQNRRSVSSAVFVVVAIGALARGEEASATAMPMLQDGASPRPLYADGRTDGRIAGPAAFVADEGIHHYDSIFNKYRLRSPPSVTADGFQKPVDARSRNRQKPFNRRTEAPLLTILSNSKSHVLNYRSLCWRK